MASFTDSGAPSTPDPPGLADAVGAMFGRSTPQQAPDPYALTPPQLVELLTKTRSFCETGRELFEFSWWRNLLYLLGRQWIYWNPTTRQWNDKRLAKWVPKPVTNMVRTTLLSIRAMTSSVQLSTRPRPNGQTPANVITAQTADDLEPVIQHEHEIKTQMSEADFWAILTGNVFLHPHWDKNDKTNTRDVQMTVCQLCGEQSLPEDVVAAGQKCPKCQSMALQSGPTQTIVVGRGRTIIASPLEVMIPLYAQSFDEVDRLIYLTWRPRHVLEDELGKEFMTALKVGGSKGPDTRSLQLFKALATTSDLQLSPTTTSTGAYTGDTDGFTEQHLWIKPCAQFPEGFYMRFIGDGTAAIPVQDRKRPDIPYKTTQGKPIWPWIHYQYEQMGGRLYAQGAIDSIIQKQDQLNQIDSMIQMVIQRMGNPIWLEPKGAEVERLTGEPGLVVRWQPVGANGAKPERIAGENPPQSFFVVREQYKNDIEEIAGTYDVMKGAKPTGVDSFAGMNLLVERSQSRFAGVFQARGEAYRRWYEISLDLERTYGPTERVRATMGPNNSWTFQTFKKTSLEGAITILVEDGANVPKTSLGRRAAVEHLRTIVPGFGQTPEQQYALFVEFGLTALMPSLDSDVKSALQEQQAFEEWASNGAQGASPLVRLPWHNDVIHLQENRKWMNSDRVRDILANAGEMLPQIMQLLGGHLQEHAQAMTAVAPPAAGAPKPGGGPGEPSGGARAMRDSNTQAGNPQTTSTAPGAAAAA